MTLFLCVVIFLELSFPDQLVEDDGSRSLIGQIFWVVNYFLLSFFMLEIGMKLFAYAGEFLSEFINVFDSVIVIISFVFQVQDTSLKAVGILRVLRLIKVIMELRRVSLAKKALQE